MNSAVLRDGKRSNTEPGLPSRAYPAQVAVDESLHTTHELVAIANGPTDYCLCGRSWPCDERTLP
jgi:hypothetical protein